jgi:hypothetical protein
VKAPVWVHEVAKPRVDGRLKVRSVELSKDPDTQSWLKNGVGETAAGLTTTVGEKSVATVNNGSDEFAPTILDISPGS